MGSDRYLLPWIWGIEEVFKSDDGAEWHDGQRLDYSFKSS